MNYLGLQIALGPDSDSFQFHCNRAAFSPVMIAREYNWLLSQIMPGDVVIDAGANTGMFSLLAAKRTGPSGKVIAIEPNTKNGLYLRRNLEANRMNNIRILNKALATEDDTFVGFSGGGVFGHIDSTGSEKVPTVSLPTIMSDLTSRAFLKMDIEGGELEIFSHPSIAQVLHKVEAMACEVHSAEAYNQVRDALSRGGFSVTRLHQESDFLTNVVRSWIRHPFALTSLYGAEGILVAKRILRKKSKDEGESRFEAGIVYASRIAHR